MLSLDLMRFELALQRHMENLAGGEKKLMEFIVEEFLKDLRKDNRVQHDDGGKKGC